MKLQNGSYYKREDGSVVKVQLESDGMLHCYTNDGEGVGRLDPDKHVEGWEPTGQSDFNKSKPAKKKATKKKAEKTAD